MPLDVIFIVDDRLERGGALAAGEGRVEGMEAREMVDRADDADVEILGLEAFQPILFEYSKTS